MRKKIVYELFKNIFNSIELVFKFDFFCQYKKLQQVNNAKNQASLLCWEYLSRFRAQHGHATFLQHLIYQS